MTCGSLETVVVLAVLLLAVGPIVLPRIVRNTGKYLGAFRHGLRDADVRREIEAELLDAEEGHRPPDAQDPGNRPARNGDRDR